MLACEEAASLLWQGHSLFTATVVLDANGLLIGRNGDFAHPGVLVILPLPVACAQAGGHFAFERQHDFLGAGVNDAVVGCLFKFIETAVAATLFDLHEETNGWLLAHFDHATNKLATCATQLLIGR